jgi:hypothetical protein
MMLIGDVHGKVNNYLNIISQYDGPTIQLGDFGYDYSILRTIDTNAHKFIGGNHEAWDTLTNELVPGYLGRFGFFQHMGNTVFYVSGGFSIDWKWRTKQYYSTGIKTFFEQEQLNIQEQKACIDLYNKVKPDILLTHEPPRQICSLMGNPEVLKSWGYNPDTFTTETSELLDCLIDIHQPKLVVSGHMHKYFNKVINKTQFVVLPELGTMEINFG